MAKQIIKLTESDLHRIIKESVNKIIREGAHEDFEAAKAALRNARAKGNRDEILAASQEFQRAKEAAGKANVISNPSAYWSGKENEKRGITPKETHKWRRKNDIGVNKQINRDEKDRLQINPDLGIDTSNGV